MGSERLVVVGGDAGGMSAASQARRMRPPSDLEIVAFERGRHTSYSACGIPYYVGKVVDDPDRLVARTPAEHAERDITVHIRTEVTSIDLDQRRVTVRDLDAGTERTEPFDILMVATGAVPIRPEMPGDDAEGIFGVQSLGDGLALREFLDTSKPQAAAVVGGGYIGLEMAEAMVHRGIHTTLIDRNPQPMATLDPDMGAMVADALRRLGCDLRLGVPVDGYETRDGRVTGVRVGDDCVPADVVVLGLGVRPNSDLAAAAGLTVGDSTRGIAVDRRMRTSADGVWAAGDCVEVFHRVSQRPAAIALGTHANKQGRVAGINIGGGYATFPGVVGTAVSKVCGVEVARTGLTEREAAAAGFAAEAVTVDSRTRAGYFPGSAPITTKLVAERVSGRLLGAQIVGEEGAAKRIDVLACALWNEMGVDEILHLDLGYAPPFSPVWDPVLIAARKAWERLGLRIG
jgi:NADPH-dependent 2,4-dienoyl-CoA reductase/sulfur reductase-like enzyme